MPYYIENGLLYQWQVTTDGENGRLYIPRALAHDLFDNIHDRSGHQGFECCMAGLKHFTVHKGARLLRQYIKHCPHCQQNQTRHHLPYGTLQPILSPAVPYHTITLDFVLGLPRLPNGNDCVLTVTDKYTKQIGLIPGKTTYTAMDWGKCLLVFWMTTDWGIPLVMISDRDKKFLSDIWQALFFLLAVAMCFTTAYHPQADGQSERTNQTVEIMIRHISQADPRLNWEEKLPQIQYQLNGSKSASTGETPHRLMYGMDYDDHGN